METWTELALAHAYVGLFVAMVVEAVGIPFPGRLTLVLAGAAAGMGHLHVAAIVGLATLGLVIGDHVWYVAGRYRGEALLRFYCRLLPRADDCVARARACMVRFGPLAFVVGRFVAGVRFLAAPLAAPAGIGYGRFLGFDVAGALLWTGTFAGLGYAIGDHGPALLARFGLLYTIALGVLVSGAGLVAAWVSRRLSRSSPDAPRPARDRRRPAA